MVIVLYRFSGLSTGLEDRGHGNEVARTLNNKQTNKDSIFSSNLSRTALQGFSVLERLSHRILKPGKRKREDFPIIILSIYRS